MEVVDGMDLFDKFQAISDVSERILEAGDNPFGVCMERILSTTRAVIGGKEVILAGTNNYLGLTFDPECLDAARDAIGSDGSGTTGSRIANGTYAGHQALEQELADFLGYRSVMVYTTGYQANLGAISGLANSGDIVFIDADCHASIYDGCVLSGATIVRFRHNDAADLDKRLGRVDKDSSNKLVVVEGMYSMLGDRAPLAEFTRVKNRHNAYLMVDEAHSLGVFGATGRGLAEEEGVLEDVDFVVGTFSKSLGAIGGFCASNHPKFDLVRITSHPYMYTASLSPSNVASVRAALRLLRARPELRDQLRENARSLYDGLTGLGYTVCSKDSPIVAVKAASQDEAAFMWNKLMEYGVYVNLAIPPGTPTGVSLLRCSVSAAHTESDLRGICTAFEKVAADIGLTNLTAGLSAAAPGA